MWNGCHPCGGKRPAFVRRRSCCPSQAHRCGALWHPVAFLSGMAGVWVLAWAPFIFGAVLLDSTHAPASRQIFAPVATFTIVMELWTNAVKSSQHESHIQFSPPRGAGTWQSQSAYRSVGAWQPRSAHNRVGAWQSWSSYHCATVRAGCGGWNPGVQPGQLRGGERWIRNLGQARAHDHRRDAGVCLSPAGSSTTYACTLLAQHLFDTAHSAHQSCSILRHLFVQGHLCTHMSTCFESTITTSCT
eukprot:1139015-Pelagomonas_calceolata.AAC.11